MPKELKIQAIKYFAVALAGYFIYKKITGGVEAVTEFAGTKLNPASDENLIYVGVQEVVGKENLSSAGISFFDAIDSAAEWVGFETGINGVKGTTAEMTRELKNG